MKKKLYSGLFDIGKRPKKFVLIMKCFLFLLLIFNLSVSAVSFSQNARFNINLKNASLERVITVMEKQSSIGFVYDYHLVKDVQGIRVNLKNATAKKVLDRVLKNTGLTYSFEKNIVVISKVRFTPKSNINIIRGKVVDEKGNPLPGVSVIVKGTSVGVSTDSKGQFNIELPKDEKGIILVFSFIGMDTKEIKLNGKDQKYIKVKLKAKKEKLEEVIVNGFKNVKKDHFTGNATVVSKKEILKANTKSIVAALQIFDPSFRIKENSEWGSDPNSMPEFNIRGESSIGMEKGMDVELMKRNQRNNLRNNPNLPVFILDGFEASVEKICDLDMQRIDEITILKDAAATSLYGSRAANGVVLIRTIAPKEGKLRVNYTFNSSVELPDLSDYNLCSAAENLEAEILAGVYLDYNGVETVANKIKRNKREQDILRGYNSDWKSKPLRNVFNHRHSIYIDGGSKSIRYGFSANYDSNKGVMKGSHRDRKGVSFVFDYIHEKFKLRNRIYFNNVSSENSPYGSFSKYTKMQPYYRIYDDEGNLIKNYSDISSDLNPNPLLSTTLESFDGRAVSNSITDNLDIEYKISKHLTFKTSFSVAKSDNSSESYIDPKDSQFKSLDNDEKGILSRNYADNLSFNFKALLYFNLNKNKHFINMLAGLDASTSKSKSNALQYQGFQISNLHSPEYAAQQKNKTAYTESESRLMGLLLSMNYSYDNIYLLDGSLRYDGSSQFGVDKRFAPFWSLGFGINLHKYSFWENINFINRFKIRASYGSTGKVNFPPYTAITTYNLDKEKWHKTGAASYLAALGNRNLKWETTNTLDFGFDCAIFNGRLNLKASYYNKKTVDLISDLYLRQASGFNSYKINSGEIVNKGFEVNANIVALRTNDLIVSIHGNIASNKNEIIKLSDAMKEYSKQVYAEYNENKNKAGISELIQEPFNEYYVGASTTAIYAVRSEGVDPCTGREIFFRKDGSRTFVWYENDKVVVGDKLPDIQGSFGFNLGYKGAYVHTSFMYEYGGQKYNSTIRSKIENANIHTQNVDKRFLTERWKKPGDVVPYLDIAASRITNPTSRFVQDNNIVSFSSLAVGYDFKNSFVKNMGLTRLGLSFNMNDIARWSTIKIERGLSYPYARNYSFTLNASF